MCVSGAVVLTLLGLTDPSKPSQKLRHLALKNAHTQGFAFHEGDRRHALGASEVHAPDLPGFRSPKISVLILRCRVCKSWNSDLSMPLRTLQEYLGPLVLGIWVPLPTPVPRQDNSAAGTGSTTGQYGGGSSGIGPASPGMGAPGCQFLLSSSQHQQKMSVWTQEGCPPASTEHPLHCADISPVCSFPQILRV